MPMPLARGTRYALMAGRGAQAFSPLSLLANGEGGILLEADDLTTLAQTIAGSTPVASANDPVGTWLDKSGNSFDLAAAADDTQRPLWQPNGGAGGASPYVAFDGTNDYLFRAADLGMFAAGACSVFVAVRGNPGTDRRLVASGNSADPTPIYAPVQSHITTATSAAGFIRGGTGGDVEAINDGTFEEANAFDNTDRVYGIVDDGSSFTPYLDGVQGLPIAYTRGTAITLDRFSVGALLRSSPVSFFAGRLYSLVVVNRVLTDAEIASLTTYLASKQGRVL